jgi:hypothetical protein
MAMADAKTVHEQLADAEAVLGRVVAHVGEKNAGVRARALEEGAGAGGMSIAYVVQRLDTQIQELMQLQQMAARVDREAMELQQRS